MSEFISYCVSVILTLRCLSGSACFFSLIESKGFMVLSSICSAFSLKSSNTGPAGPTGISVQVSKKVVCKEGVGWRLGRLTSQVLSKFKKNTTTK